MSYVVADLEQLADFVSKIANKVKADEVANKYESMFNKDPNKKSAYGTVINTAIIEIASSLPKKGNSDIQKVFTTYYMNEDPSHGYRLVRHTTSNKSLTTQYMENEVALRNELHGLRKSAVEEEEVVFQYERLFNQIFDKIINDFQSIGGNTVGLMDKALIRKCKFVRVDKGTLSVGYSKMDKKYIVRYNPQFCVDATVEYFVNPVLDDSGNYRSSIPTIDNILYPTMFFLSHEFAHVLYRHVTNNDSSLQEDLPHYVKQYFGDAYINNSIPYLLGADYGRTNSGDQSELFTAKAHHPIGINEQVPVDNYLKPAYAVEIYKTLLSQEEVLVDSNVSTHLKKYVDIAPAMTVKSSLTDNLGYASVQEFEDALNSLPVDVKKKILRSHVKFFTGNFYDIMSRVFTKGFSSNSYMRVLKSLLESLFEDIKDTEAATKKEDPPQPEPQDAPQDQPQDQGEEGDPAGEPPPMPGSGEGDSGQSGESDDESGADGESGTGGEGSQSSEDSPDSSNEGDSGGTGDHDGKYKVGDMVRQRSTGKIGKIVNVYPDGTYDIDPTQTIQENLGFVARLKMLFESIIRVSEDDLEIYQSSEDSQSEEGDSADPSQDSGDGSDNPEDSESDDPRDAQDSQSGDSGQKSAEQDGGEPNPDDTGDQESDGSRDVDTPDGQSQEGDSSQSDGDGPPAPPSLDQDTMDNSGNEGGDSTSGGGSSGDEDNPDYGDGSSGPDDFPSLPPEDQPDSQDGQQSQSPSSGESDSNGSQNQQQQSDDDQSGSGNGGQPSQRQEDGFDDLRDKLDQSHEDSKTGISDSTNDYLEEDDRTREEADRELDEDSAKDQIKDTIKEAVADAQEQGKDVDEILKGLDQKELSETFAEDMMKTKKQVSQSQWKVLFRQLISLASGYKLNRDNARPSRKVEGLWGANTKVPAIKDVVLLLDCSGSMSSPQFKAIFAELKELGRLPELKDTWVHLIPWGSSAEYRRYKGLNPVTVKQMYQFGKVDLGGTFIATGYEMMMKKVRNPDLVIVLTDSEYSDYRSWKRDGKLSSSTWGGRDIEDMDKVMSFIKRTSRKTVYVSIAPESSYMNEMLDPSYKRRLLDIDPSISRSGGDDLDD
jgi:hypothetical protein